jgi:thiazole synthase
MPDPLIIAGREFASRLFLGTAGYPNRMLMLDAIAASGTEMVTASIRRISLAGEDESLVDLIPKHIRFLPNTAGCQTAKDAVLTAELAREALETNWIKLEVIGDRELLYPDTEELVRGTETLVAKGFTVLPYCTDDPRRLIRQRIRQAETRYDIRSLGVPEAAACIISPATKVRTAIPSP